MPPLSRPGAVHEGRIDGEGSVIQVHGEAGGTTLTGTLYEPGEEAPTFHGAPDDGSRYRWVCDEFYEVYYPKLKTGVSC